MMTLLKKVGVGGKRELRWPPILTVVSGFYLFAATICHVQGTQPLVAIHDSEYTRALENQNASGATPTGANTTGKQWWPTDWHYFVMPEAIKEALRSDGTAFTVVGDSNIIAGVLLTNGMPKYPIVISLASEAIHDSQIAPFTNYVAAGGFLFVGSSAFTRNTNGTTRSDFAFANEMGIHMVTAALTNWALNSTYTKVVDHRIQTHVPGGTISWRLPSSSEEIPYGVSPGPLSPHDDEQAQQPHDVWQIVNSNATVLAQGQATPFLTIRAYGKGYFIYCAAMQPLLGNGGWAPTMYNYLTFRRSIEWAFENAGLPVAKLSPWPYPYDAAFMVRHDLESFSNAIAAVEASAQFEFTNGCTGDYYFCTGTLRENMSPVYNTNDVVAGLRRAMTNYGATIGPHNGGLTNPMIMGTPNSYDYWHWGPDEVLDIPPPPGYSSGSNYAYVSMLRSFQNIESWLPGLMTNGMRVWCGPYYNSTREGSLNIQAQLGVKVTGEQKVAPFPHWSLSTQTPNKRFGILQQPPSDWFVGEDISHSIEAGHTIGTLRGAIDYYYNLGGLLNFYSHTLSTGLGRAGPRATEYVTYSMDTNRFPRLWSANAIKIYNWWQQRSNVQMTVSITTNGTQINTAFTIKNSTHTNTTIELTPPLNTSFCNLQVFTNGAMAGANLYRLTGATIKIRVGTTVTNVLVSYYPLGGNVVALAENFDAPSAPSLPAGWTSSATGAQAPWVSQAASADSPSNSVFVANGANVGTGDLVSPIIAVSAGQAQLTFRNNYNLENGIGGIGYDGGVLEIKIGSGPFTDIITAGGAFVSGGYNAVIDNTFSSPIAGRPAWSGSSGGYLTTTVSLPMLVTNQNIQLRWRCATDNGGNATGWRIDSISLSNRICLCCLTGTNTPVLPTQTNRTVNENSPLTVTNTATDADVGETLFYSLQSPPSGAVISGSGIITWTPSVAFGGTTNPITTIVTDSTDRKATNSFNVIVLHVNTAPVLPVQTNRTIGELATLSVTNTATDSDLPANTLSYSLLVAPGGASISANGIITWPTTEATGPGNFTFTTRVVDNGTPALSATNTFTVTVNEINSAPTLPGQSNRTINESTALVVTNTASDGDLPANTLSYQLINPPAGASINSSGIINWTPTESQGPATNTLTTVVTDNGTPNLSATNSFVVIVSEVNSPPSFTATPTNQTIAELTALTVTNAATDSDVPTNILSYVLTGPALAVINTNTGVITWTPTEADGPGTNTFTTVVSDGTVSITNSFIITVTEANQPPALPAQTNRTLAEFALLTVTNTATDGDLPANTLTYQLLNPPGNAAINASGIITWTPGGSEGPATNTITTVVSDGVASVTNSFTVIVTDGNQAPTLPAQTNRTIAELTLLTVTNTATDLDTPAIGLTYQLLNPPAGAAINSSGIITWTPTEAQGPGSNTITTVVNDGTFTATNSFQVTVTETNQLPVLPAQTDRSIDELSLLIVTNSATDADLPANALSYQLLNPPANARITTAGVILWKPTVTQGLSANLFTTVVSDGAGSATNSFAVTVNDTLSGLTTNVTLISTGSVWSYLDNGSNQGTAWRNLGFDASTWSNGPAQLGFGDGDEQTVISYGTNSSAKPITTYFRRTFSIADASLFSALNLRVLRDDGVVIYLNGTEVYRNNLPLTAITYQTLALGAIGGVDETTFVNAPLDLASLVNGANIVAVEMHQNSPSSSDLSFDLELTGVLNLIAPGLPAQTNQTIPELTTLTVTNTATDLDTPANALTYQLVNAPGNAAIDAAGVITWTPQENEGPGSGTLITVVSDGTVSVTNSFVVTVTEVNQAPVLPVQTNRTIAELALVTVTNTATDGDLPVNTLTYQLVNPPGNAAISGSGVITWTPQENVGPGSRTITTVVSDGTVSVTNSFIITVTEVNQSPVLPTQTNRTIAELTLLTVTNTATDGDLPANTLSYQLLNAPVGMNISGSGVISWTPNEAAGPGTNTITTVVVDGTASVTNTFLIIVTEANTPPLLNPIGNRTVHAGGMVSFTAMATDADVPAQTLNFSLLNTPPTGAGIASGSGLFEWLTTNADVNTTNTVTVQVADAGVPVLSTNRSFVVTVIARPQITNLVRTNGVVAVTWSSIAGQQYRLQRADALLPTNWQDVGADVTATGSFTTQTNATSGVNARFYRVRLAP